MTVLRPFNPQASHKCRFSKGTDMLCMSYMISEIIHMHKTLTYTHLYIVSKIEKKTVKFIKYLVTLFGNKFFIKTFLELNLSFNI